jgi:hypothetical protein
MARACIASRLVYRFEYYRRGAQRQLGAAVLLRNQRGKITGIGERGDKFLRIAAVVFESAPLFAPKRPA